jgi:hypothetical protein
LGYAQAQVLPLRQIHTSNSALETGVVNLASAYEEFYKTNGSAEAKKAVSTASDQVNAICPGAAT